MFAPALLAWYDKHKRNLPWRRTKDPYKIWVSEMMLQQTTVNAVIGYYDRWFQMFPTVGALAGAGVEKVLKAWQGLGYYARARNLHKAAQVVVREHHGVLPRDPAVVRALPGFGPYSTGSVLSIAYDLPLTIIDANVRRVAMRLLALQGHADTKQDRKIGGFLQTIFPPKHAGDFNQALMELGALVCRSKEPLCILCPVIKFCRAFARGRQEIIPKPKQRMIKDVAAVIAIIRKGNKFFIQQRPAKGLLAGLWEFPGGKIRAGEGRARALAREIREELNVSLKTADYLFQVTHFYTQFKVNLSVFLCATAPLPKADEAHKWVNLKSIHQYPMPSGSAKIVRELEKINGIMVSRC
ncbi:MAG: A/G-specific adenine glycosylase [Candidatus Omnitrophica bacterium]|nr:A/G-specific adenine glycosylase [Candidatus Omnitrophota bacterium]